MSSRYSDLTVSSAFSQSHSDITCHGGSSGRCSGQEAPTCMNEFGHSGKLASVIMRLDVSHKPAQPHPNVLNAFSLDAPPPWINQLPELQENSLVFINFPVHETLL